MSTRQISLSQFAGHCVEELATAQRQHTILEIMGAEGPLALVSPLPAQTTGTIADWIGTGAGFTLAPGCTLEDPAFEPNEWEDATTDDQL